MKINNELFETLDYKLDITLDITLDFPQNHNSFIKYLSELNDELDDFLFSSLNKELKTKFNNLHYVLKLDLNNIIDKN